MLKGHCDRVDELATRVAPSNAMPSKGHGDITIRGRRPGLHHLDRQSNVAQTAAPTNSKVMSSKMTLEEDVGT